MELMSDIILGFDTVQKVLQMRSRWLRPFGQHHVPDIPVKREVTAEQDAGFLSKLWFAWISPLMTVRLCLSVLYL
ncbi:FAD-dependent monooxygenase azaH [Fusarium oxysporum f. sp. albedinis]|nr:FAD-dependent monooxygenase azaH [Fusarium oxysporum f. sp. albedinis]